MSFEKLRQDPFGMLQHEESPYAYWVRRHLQGRESKEDESMRRRLIDGIVGKQADDGSFDGKVSNTVEGLFKMVLLDAPRENGRRGVDWLMDKKWETTSGLYGCRLFNRMTSDDIEEFRHRRDLLFNYGCSAFINTAAVIHFVGYFGATDMDSVGDAIECMKKIAKARKGLFCSPYCSDNVLRAFLKNPATKECETSNAAVEAMEVLLLPEGGWRNCPYPYHTFNAIAQSHTTSARRQIERTFPRLVHKQNADGTWGKEYYRHFATFLVLDGINEQGMLAEILPRA